MVLNFESVNVAHKCVMKTFNQHLPMVLFIMLYKVVLPFEGDNMTPQIPAAQLLFMPLFVSDDISDLLPFLKVGVLA